MILSVARPGSGTPRMRTLGGRGVSRRVSRPENGNELNDGLEFDPRDVTKVGGGRKSKSGEGLGAEETA